MVATFFEQRLKSTGATVDSSLTESTADPAVTARDPRSGRPAPGGARNGIPWAVIAGRDDQNKDGKVTKEEFSGPPPLFQRLDTNGDGVLTPEDRGETDKR